MKKINKKLVIGLLIGGVFLWLTLRQVDFASCWHYIRSANLYFILLAVFVYTLAFIIRSARWKYLLAPIVASTARRLFFFIQMGFFMNNVLPLRLGEIIRANVTGQKLNVSRSSVLATVVVERLFDGLGYICLFFATVIFLPFPGWAKKSFIAGSVIFIGALTLLYFFVRHQEKTSAVLDKLPSGGKFWPRLKGIFVNFMDGLKIFSHGTGLLKVFLLTLVVWIIEGTVYYTVSVAFNLNLNLLQTILVMIIIGTGAILPTAPGYVGTVEFLGVTSLSFLGVDKNLAFGYIITLHFLQIITIAFWGMTGMAREKITFHDLILFEKQR